MNKELKIQICLGMKLYGESEKRTWEERAEPRKFFTPFLARYLKSKTGHEKGKSCFYRWAVGLFGFGGPRFSTTALEFGFAVFYVYHPLLFWHVLVYCFWDGDGHTWQIKRGSGLGCPRCIQRASEFAFSWQKVAFFFLFFFYSFSYFHSTRKFNWK